MEELRTLAIALLLLIVVIRGTGVLWPKKFKGLAKWIGSQSDGTLKGFAVVLLVIGLWVLYNFLFVLALEPEHVFLSAIGVVFVFAATVYASTGFLREIIKVAVRQSDKWISMINIVAVALAAVFLYLIFY